MIRVTKDQAVRYFKMALVLPIVLIWDSSFWLITFLQKQMEKIDTVGGNWLEKFIGDDHG